MGAQIKVSQSSFTQKLTNKKTPPESEAVANQVSTTEYWLILVAAPAAEERQSLWVYVYVCTGCDFWHVYKL